MTPVARLLSLAVRAYQLLVRPILPPVCRYEPSCSQYALEALRRHGAIIGTGLAARRVLRCHPWAEGGYDPVPHSLGCGSHAGEVRSHEHPAS
ncbi:MAG TPA: membrane protein insertion efficiency factor YidD [Alphaproteobacteria bacterium]|nr:membrane protein insertion efficiency factor YidD [Alphaproteobacteria bacterium]